MQGLEVKRLRGAIRTPTFRRFARIDSQKKQNSFSRGVSGGSLHGGASFKVEKGHFAAWKKGPENRK